MAASMPWLPFPFGPQIPVTPPPDHQSFSLAQGPPPLSPNLLKSFSQEIYGNGNSILGSALNHSLNNGFSGGLKTAGYQARMMANQRPAPGSVAAGVSGAGKHVFPPPPPPLQRQQNKQQPNTKTEAKETKTAASTATTTTAPSASDKTTAGGSTTTGATTAVDTTATATTAVPSTMEGPLSASDPRYLAMASRIAAYYHQRCQAVANFQQQRCQAWANMQRQKSQEMTQAAMLVVAWYIRDRIQRRRRREKRQFRRGLAAKAAGNNPPATRANGARGAAARRGAAAAGTTGGRITKGEAVRKWVLQIPESSAALSPNTPGARDRPVDPDEVSFDIDRDTVSDKDMRLYNVADNLIKSQLARIDVPMMGALSFEPSESETDSDEEEEEEEEDNEDEDEPIGPGGHNDEDDIMLNYEERGAPIEAVAVGVEAMITDATATAIRAGLGAGAGIHRPVSAGKAASVGKAVEPAAAEDDEEYYMEEDDDDYDFEDDEEFEEEDYEEDDGQQVSELVHHGTGAGSGSSGSRQQTSSFP
ncbi:hypothetical protein SEUCBS139899_006408 [Sporothrix eucalyptigena]